MLATTRSYEYCGYQIRIDCYRQPVEHTWSATYRITRATDGAVTTNGAIVGGYRSPEEVAVAAKTTASSWVDREARS